MKGAGFEGVPEKVSPFSISCAIVPPTTYGITTAGRIVQDSFLAKSC